MKDCGQVLHQERKEEIGRRCCRSGLGGTVKSAVCGAGAQGRAAEGGLKGQEWRARVVKLQRGWREAEEGEMAGAAAV